MAIRQSHGFGISTHSRAKAAGPALLRYSQYWLYFNSQPREGGWNMAKICESSLSDFNSQPREGGWVRAVLSLTSRKIFQLTAARRRLAKTFKQLSSPLPFQLTAARRRLDVFNQAFCCPEAISTHSRAKAAGRWF